MKTYEAKYNPLINKGVYGISLVEAPAMEGFAIALKADSIQLKEVDKEKRILAGLVLEPNKPIYRNQNGEEFNIVFTDDTPLNIIHELLPDILFKGADYKNKRVIGSEYVIKNGGKIEFIDIFWLNVLSGFFIIRILPKLMIAFMDSQLLLFILVNINIW